MPTYEYACTSCGEHLEVVQSFSDEPLTACPKCGGPLRKVFGSIGIVLKGSGFYKTDNRKGGSSSSSSSAGSSSAKSEASSSGTSSADKSSSDKSSGSGSSSSSSSGDKSSGSSSAPAAASA